MPKSFSGEIKLDIRDSTPDWPAFLADRAPEGAPNVLVVLYDDTGCAAWSPYGGRINMPTMDRLADNGLTYSQWHTTSLCSPTRSVFLTGRNHHQNGFATISESSTGFPGYNSHIPRECASMATVLRNAGWSTFWVGKNHNTPVDAWTMGSSKKDWRLGLGYDRFYGFMGGETNQWYPDLAEDNHYIDQPYLPADGYHLSKDLADKALEFLRDSKQTEPDKPWYLWFCPGANHAPHHAPEEYIAKYKGMFDDGYEAYREWVLQRMIERGIVPESTELTPINPMTPGTFAETDSVRPWDSLSDDEKRLFSRMAEVYAAFSEFTDAQVGRIVDYLEESGQLHNTLILYCADNGASGEGSPNGSVNENKFFNAWPDTIEDNMALLDRLGTEDTYNHYPTGWAVAFSTPYRMFKRYSYQGGVCDPLVIHWPAGIEAKGEVRHQYHHCTDIVPTILDCCGVEMPAVVDGYEQKPLPGVSMCYSFDAADAPTQKETQYYEMLGTRAIWHQGWKAVTEHGPVPIGLGSFDNDRWQLFHTDEDRAEAHDVADENPEKVKELKDLWLESGREVRRPPAQRPLGTGVSGARVRDRRSGKRPVHVLPGDRSDPAGIVGEHDQRLLQDPRRGGVHQGVGGRHRRARVAVRRLHAVRQGRHAHVRLQLPGHPAGADAHCRRSIAGDPHRRRRVHQGPVWREPRADRNGEAPRRRSGRRGDRDPHDGVAVQPLR
jgi:arylsulfatase A-like enzyme